MPELHSIRLHGPWQATRISHNPASQLACDTTGDATSHPVTIPLDVLRWTSDHEHRCWQLERRFGMPTRVDSQQAIWLVIETENLAAQVRLNGDTIGSIASDGTAFRVRVDSRLAIRNHLQLEISSTPATQQHGLASLAVWLHGVRLEIAEA